MNEYKVKVVLNGLDEVQEKVDALRKSLDELKHETAEVQQRIDELELVIQIPERYWPHNLDMKYNSAL